MRHSYVRRLIFALAGLFVVPFALPENLVRREAAGADAKGADAAAPEAYVAVDALPVFSADGLIAVLKRGQAVSVVDVAQLEAGGDFHTVEWTDGEKKQSGSVTRHGLSKTKPDAGAPQAEAKPAGAIGGAPAAPDAAQERKRLEGTWTIAGVSVLGQVNPDPRKPAGPNAPSPLPAGIPVPVGMPKMDAAPIGMYMPSSRFFRFHDGRLTLWTLLPYVDAKQPQTTWKPTHQAELAFDVDPKATPGRLDTYNSHYPPRMRQPTPGIYRWEGSDVLVWAKHTTMGDVSQMITPNTQVKPRLAGFKPDELKQATVLYLIRADEKKYPAPKAPKTPAQQQGGNAF